MTDRRVGEWPRHQTAKKPGPRRDPGDDPRGGSMGGGGKSEGGGIKSRPDQLSDISAVDDLQLCPDN